MKPSKFAESVNPAAMLAEAKRVLDLINVEGLPPLSADPKAAEAELDAWRAIVLSLAHAIIIGRQADTREHAAFGGFEAGEALASLAAGFHGVEP